MGFNGIKLPSTTYMAPYLEDSLKSLNNLKSPFSLFILMLKSDLESYL